MVDKATRNAQKLAYDKANYKKVTLKLKTADYARLKHNADISGITVSEYIRNALKAYEGYDAPRPAMLMTDDGSVPYQD